MGQTDSSQPVLLGQARNAARGIDETFQVSAFADSVKAFEEAQGPATRAQLLRQLLRQLASENRSQIDSQNYPLSVRELIHKEFDRIAKDCDEKEDAAFDFNDFHLRCDFRITCFGRVPVGPQHLELTSLPGSVLTRGGFSQGVRYLKTLLQAGGRSPFYALHLAGNIWPPAFRMVYSAEAQRQMFLRLADCMEMNPEIRGVMSVGWLFDPQLEFVTPELSYLREGWIENGAGRFFWEISDATTYMATTNSAPRTALYEDGKFLPESHMVIWPRKSLIAWSKQQREKS